MNDKQLFNEIEVYLRLMYDDSIPEGFIESVYNDVILTSGYEEEGLYSIDDIIICTKRNIVELINESY